MSDTKDEIVEESIFETKTIEAINSINSPVVKTDVGEVERLEDDASLLKTGINKYFVDLLSGGVTSGILNKLLNKLESMVDDMDDAHEVMKAISLLLQYKSKQDESITSLFKSTGQDKSMIDLLDRKNDESGAETAFNQIESSADLKTLDSLIRGLNKATASK